MQNELEVLGKRVVSGFIFTLDAKRLSGEVRNQINEDKYTGACSECDMKTG